MAVPQANASEKADTLVNVLGVTKCQSITNMYKWLDNSLIDPAWQVLINKYQTDLTRDHLRFAILTHVQFEKAAVAYEKISKALMSMK
jgi:arsenate reductase-like glutaredoxin family protein